MGNSEFKSNSFYKELEESLHKQEVEDTQADNQVDHCIYNKEGVLIYQGGYKNKKLNGWGKIYNSKGDLRYEGNFKDDLPDGNGSLFLYKIRYQGTFINGKLEGQGHIIHEEDDPKCKTEYTCTFNNGKIVKE